MKLKVSHVFDALQTLDAVKNRPMPVKAAFRLSLMRAKIAPVFDVIAERRNALIRAYDYQDEQGTVCVPPESLAEFNAAWAEIAAEEVDIDVEPISVAAFETNERENGALTVADFAALGDLVVE